MSKSYSDLTVEEFTSPAPATVSPKTGMSEIVDLMESEGIRHVPVVENGEAVGIISDRDIKIVEFLQQIDSIVAKDIMTDTPYTVTSNTPLSDVAFEMSSKKIGSAMVTDAHGQLVGIFTSTDSLNALVEVLRGDVLS